MLQLRVCDLLYVLRLTSTCLHMHYKYSNWHLFLVLMPLMPMEQALDMKMVIN